MRESVGSYFILNLMIIFIFFFAAFLAIAINYSQAFRVKNVVINSIEQLEGLSQETQETIFNRVNDFGYFRDINCDCTDFECNGMPENSNGAPVHSGSTQLDGVCIKKIKTGEDVYYRVTTFVGYDIPVAGLLFSFPVRGETKVITNPQE